MKLGKIQKAWVESLKANPQRQMTNKLGKGTPKDYTACCLGELLCVRARLRKKKLPFTSNNIIRDGGFSSSISLDVSFNQLGLKSDIGQIDFSIDGAKDWLNQSKPKSKGIETNGIFCLANMNDNGWTWPEIAEFIQKFPEAVFTKSV